MVNNIALFTFTSFIPWYW